MSTDAVDTGRVVVFGSANQDHVLGVEDFPQAGETVLSRSYTVGLGGKGANQAVAAARAGASVAFVGAVGADSQGDAVLANFAAHGIDTRSTARSADEATGVAIVLVDARGRNEIIVAPGANADLRSGTVDAAIDTVMPHDVVVVQCEIPVSSVERIVRGAARRGATVIVNLAPYAALAPPVFDAISLLIVNESEALSLLGRAEAPQNLAPAVAASVGCACIVTLGEDGSLYAAPDGAIATVPAVRVGHVVDTTGAGDVYVGTLAAATARREDVVSGMGLASAAAARSVSTQGAQAPHQEATANAVV